MKLLTLVLLMSALSALVVTEVVKSFKEHCSRFFFNKKTPTAPKWGEQKMICQRWKNRYMYATLYDTRLRIPVYSAYNFNVKFKTERDKYWMNEPQLEKINKTNKEMKWISDAAVLETYTHQAVDKDYKDYTDYTRGHVYPNLFSMDQDQADSTFTFTNVAPQTNESNLQWANKVEEPMQKEIIRLCALSIKTPAYIVTGVVPGKNWIPITRKETIPNGINIPSYYWSAYCCKNANGEQKSKAYLCEQNTDKPVTAQPMTVTKLNTELEKLYNTKPFKVFGDKC